MAWRKLGRVFSPDDYGIGDLTHASTPAVEVIGSDCVRVYFSSRDGENRSSIYSLDLLLEGDRFDVLKVAEKPILQPGEKGLFDDSGVSMGSLIVHDGECYLYYVGWNLGTTVPWRNTIGLAIRRNGEVEFEKVSQVPILDRSAEDPLSMSYPWVIRENTGDWRMFYGSNLSWGASMSEMEHVMKQSVSKDGIHWERNTEVIFPPSEAGGMMMARPCVVRDGDRYRMWFSWRGETYRIGYAESDNGKQWVRKDGESGISVSTEGWDSESVEYPCVFQLGQSQYMLFNGNGYGKTGFGIAIRE